MNPTEASHLTPPPALTWTHLFPSGTAYHYHGGPPWFVDEVSTHLPSAPVTLSGNRAEVNDPPNRVKIVWADDAATLASASAYDGIAAINCRKFPVARLRAAGFSYIRHFAAVPNLANARWFVPLDSPAVSAAGLSLYTPSRRSAKLKRAAARLAMYARLPVWYRDDLWIAQRHLPPLEAAINPLTGAPNVRWALSSGAPLGARNRKASALVLGQGGKLLSFVKIARSDIARRIAARESDVLLRLAQNRSVRASAPEVIYSGDVDDDRVLAQSPLPGEPAPVAFTPAHRAFLASLKTPVIVRAAFTTTVAEMAGRLLAISNPHPALLDTFYRTLPTLQKFEVPITITHGDFAPWNLRIHEGRIGAFDWEYGEIAGLPLMDEIHYRLQTGWLLEKWNADDAIRCLRTLANERPLRLEPSHVDAIAIIYLLDALARLLGEGYGDEQDVVVWHQSILDRLSPRRMPRKEAVAA